MKKRHLLENGCLDLTATLNPDHLSMKRVKPQLYQESKSTTPQVPLQIILPRSITVLDTGKYQNLSNLDSIPVKAPKDLKVLRLRASD